MVQQVGRAGGPVDKLPYELSPENTGVYTYKSGEGKIRFWSRNFKTRQDNVTRTSRRKIIIWQFLVSYGMEYKVFPVPVYFYI